MVKTVIHVLHISNILYGFFLDMSAGCTQQTLIPPIQSGVLSDDDQSICQSSYKTIILPNCVRVVDH